MELGEEAKRRRTADANSGNLEESGSDSEWYYGYCYNGNSRDTSNVAEQSTDEEQPRTEQEIGHSPKEEQDQERAGRGPSTSCIIQQSSLPVAPTVEALWPLLERRLRTHSPEELALVASNIDSPYPIVFYGNTGTAPAPAPAPEVGQDRGEDTTSGGGSSGYEADTD